jgi:hypothetical protein
MTFEITSEALGHRIKSVCKSKGMDATKAAARHVSDRLMHHWHIDMPPLPMMVTGGLTAPQYLRPTADADVRLMRRCSQLEVHRGLAAMSPMLAAEGITLHSVSDERIFAIGADDYCSRYRVEATCGGLRANTSLDLSVGHGKFGFPADGMPPLTAMPSFLPRTPPSIFRPQPYEMSAADKWHAVLAQPPGDLRVKHTMDLLCYDNMDLEQERLVAELVRGCHRRGINPASLPVCPASLSFSSWAEREESWVKLAAERTLPTAHGDAWVDLNGLWRETHARLQAHIIRDFRRRWTPTTTRSIETFTNPSLP